MSATLSSTSEPVGTYDVPRGSVLRAALAAPVLMTALIVLVGAPLGFLWAAVAPHVDLRRTVLSPEQELNRQFTIDVWFIVIGIAAAIIIGTVSVYLLKLRNVAMVPWIYAGLAGGGFLAAKVMETVGERIREPKAIPALLKNANPDDQAYVLSLVHFTLRATAGLYVLPVVAIAIFTLVMHLQTQRPTVVLNRVASA